MPSFLANLPVWVLVIVGLILAYAGYKYWQYKKATSYKPPIATMSPVDFTSLRDNPQKA